MAVQKRSVWLIAFQGIVASAYLCLTAMVLAFERPAYARFPAILATGAIAALVFRLGWLIPCTLVGPIIGVMTMPAVRMGPIDAQREEDVIRIVFWTIAGFILGFCIDASNRAAQRETSQTKTSDGGQPINDSMPG
jgi:hypothetical protein